MASSSKRPHSSKSKQGESTSKSNPLNLTRLLANDAQRKVFEENFHGRSIFTPKYGNIGNFEFDDFLFPYLLRKQKNCNFCCEANVIYPELVRIFYCIMNFRKNLVTSHVKGKDIVLDMKTFSSICCDIPMIGDISGFGLVCEWDDRKKFYLSICRISKEEIERRKQQSLGETIKNRDILSVGYLTLEDRLIHYFLTYVRLPKFSNHSQKSDRAPIDRVRPKWPSIFAKARLILSDEPEPTAKPNQPESHAQSSSSAAMPTDQMIMDELVSLRGYITTRMDAFDTQSQQIHYEFIVFHRG
ncbi:hypothetical protein Lal_00028231 [Lupinus albus]|nr:hypothetical protein Lal_00028231 [Lupinus albus]